MTLLGPKEAIFTPGPGRAPDFLCIGAQKAGTTWLHHMLADHPETWMPPAKELHFFNMPGPSELRVGEFHARFARQLAQGRVGKPQMRWLARFALSETVDPAWYHGLFHEAGPRVTGDMTPAYAALDLPHVKAAKEVVPEAKIIYVLREPVERFWSTYKEMVLRPSQDPQRLISEKDYLAKLQEPYHLARSRYGQALETWEGVFGAEKVLTLFHEDITAAPLTLLERVCGFLGLNFSPAYFPRLDQRVKASDTSLVLPDDLPRAFAQLHLQHFQDLAKRFPEPVGAWVVGLEKALNAG